MKIYFAGKVRKDCYRTKLLNNDRVMDVNQIYHIDGVEIWYAGPNAISCVRGCFHRHNSHGLKKLKDPSCVGVIHNGNTRGFERNEIVEKCFSQIENCDLFYAYIESIDCYGTLVEIGYAVGLGKKVYVEIDKKVQKQAKEIWFALRSPGVEYAIVHTPSLIPYIKAKCFGL